MSRLWNPWFASNYGNTFVKTIDGMDVRFATLRRIPGMLASTQGAADLHS